MKKCEDFELLINLSLDGFLSEAEEAELQTHLKQCPVCLQKYRQLKSIVDTLSEMEAPVPAEMHDRIMTAIANEAVKTTPKVKRFPLRKVCSGIAAAAACVALGVVALRFAPSVDLDYAVSESMSDSAMPPEYSQEAPGGTVNNGMPFYDTEFKPSQNVVQPNTFPELPADPKPEPAPEPLDQTGQVAEDLPPLRTDNDISSGKQQSTSICKWLKVTGRKADMPDWVDWSSVYSTELDGEAYEYLQIKAWAETVWLDHFTASGFVVEKMEGKDLDPEGECVLLLFVWQS